ncbi:hypothetical protein OE88DRAFT_1636537 [Heliocybe sulcata]|uniref:Uncharacterized protein n=1 Tax=Heliocybe sulcata TaxID=5364 RepID=A0A5C3MU11_9AGAM|nr:hypothetical protein OE88DRAFT_1636537 [Heliocybe sulcata]
MEDSVRYESEGREANALYSSMLPPGGDVVYIGPSREPYSLALFHQLRCLDVMWQDYLALRGASNTSRDCLQYLRQTLLCHAETRLEPARSPRGPRLINFSYDYICRDWSAVYSTAASFQ